MGFILDQRCKEGRIVSRWLVFIRKKYKDITFEDLADFMQKLAHTFLHSYSLPTKQYYEAVRILCYRCIFRQKIIKKIIFDLLNVEQTNNNEDYINIKQCNNLDAIYQKKVMWMRALNEEQLGIQSKYWLKKEISFDNKLNVMNSKQSQKWSSFIADSLLAGKDIPFAHSINLMGQLELDYHVIQKYKNKTNPDSKHKDIIPFVLPQEALQTLLSATKSIYKTAMQYYYKHNPEKKGDANDEAQFISQDDLFPIILYCVMQSKLETPHKLIYFIEHILPKEKTTMGQSAFALSALKAAVEYISNAKPTTFGMDAEIELD